MWVPTPSGVGTTNQNFGGVEMLIMSLSAKTTTNTTGSAQPGVIYNAPMTVYAQAQVEAMPKENKIDLKSFFKFTEKIQIKVKQRVNKEYAHTKNVPSTIFGTVYGARLFLTATSCLSIDKQDVSPLLTAPCASFSTRGGSLVLGGAK
jgi:hypothetical protein